MLPHIHFEATPEYLASAKGLLERLKAAYPESDVSLNWSKDRLTVTMYPPSPPSKVKPKPNFLELILRTPSPPTKDLAYAVVYEGYIPENLRKHPDTIMMGWPSDIEMGRWETWEHIIRIRTPHPSK